jgi:predicted nucleic acid-binding protein
MKFVSNSTPLIALSKINRLTILTSLCGTVLIPEEVYDEVVTRGGFLFGADDVRSASWISVVPVQNRTAVDALYVNIDRGEAEAIILAKEEDALLIIDDKDGRDAALAVNLQITGTIGILLMAAEGGLLNFREDFRALREAGFRISEKEYQKILDLSGF